MARSNYPTAERHWSPSKFISGMRVFKVVQRGSGEVMRRNLWMLSRSLVAFLSSNRRICGIVVKTSFRERNIHSDRISCLCESHWTSEGRYVAEALVLVNHEAFWCYRIIFGKEHCSLNGADSRKNKLLGRGTEIHAPICSITSHSTKWRELRYLSY